MSRSNTNNDNTSRISGHIRDLLTHFLPADSPTQVFEGYQKYVLNILSSRIPAPNLDENTLRTNILKKVEKNDQENSTITKQKRDANSAKVNELFQRLARLKVFKNRFSTCYLLWKISKENEKVSQPVQGVSALETAILSKQQTVTANRINRGGGMEVENQAPSSYGRGGNSGSLLRRMEPKENILKIVHQISNKGNANIDVSENDLLRDILFAFQGIDGNYILFSSHEDRYTIKPTISLSEPVRKMVLGLCEMGWLYRKLFGFMNQIQNEAQGLVYQTLCDALKQELDEYYRLIAMLESLRDADDEQSRSSFLVENKPAEKSLSLRKLALWSIEPMERLRWMCIVCDACRNSKGGTIISSITSYGKQGSPSIQALVNRILKKVLAPFSNFLYQWVYKGELADEHQEFFITMDPYVKDDNLWANRYSLRKEMIPAFMEFELAEKILKTGKSVNFLKKYGGLLNEWNLNIPFINLGTNLETEDNNINQPLNYSEWKEWAIKSYEVTSKTLLSVMFEKFSIMTHYETIRKFLLFAQGDFTQYLMDLLVNELVKPASTLYKHNLTSFLETALRASNAQHISPEILARVDVKLLDASPGDNGWDIFSLTYNVDAPLTTVISAKTMTGYLRLFNIFWRIKRIENSLNGIWVQHMKSARLVEKMPEYRMHFRKVNILRNEMFHFIENLLNYLLIEVVQSEWENFVEKLRKAQDLDEVIGLHEEYVNSMLEKALLTVRSEKIYKQMLKIFDLIGRFKSTQEIMTSSIQEELYKKTSGIDRSYITETAGNESSLFLTDKLKDNRTLDLGMFGGGGGNTARTAMKRETMISLKNIGKDYKDAFLGLMELLRDDALAGKLRFLTFRLDFNEYYTSINPNNVSLRDRDIEDFRAGYNRPSFQTMIIEQQPNRNSAWNRNEIKRPSSIPKKEEPSSSKMIIEEPTEISKDKTLPLDHGQSFNLSHTQEPFKSGFLKTIDLDTSQQQAGLPPNLSDIRQKFDRLTTLLGQTMNKGTEGNTSVSKIGGDSGIYLKSLNFGDEPKEKKE